LLACAVTALAFSGCDGGGFGDPCLGTGTLPPDSLEEYSAKCLDAIGLDVPAFSCDDGTVIPQTNISTDPYPSASCDAPNVLSGRCDPGSTFQVLAQTDEAIVVALCRKKGAEDGIYRDIAVIQYNQVNGATCFYQALDDALEAAVTAPSDTSGTFPWFSPPDTAIVNCVECHDNGPFIRSPYLAQLRNEPANRLPGTNADDNVWGPPNEWNKFQPYTFVGNDFQSWQVESLSLPDVSCMNCHRMAVSKTEGAYHFGAGTALNFGPISTAMDQTNKNIHSEDSPIWMKPDQELYLAEVESDALAVQACALAIVGEGPLPAGCTAVAYGGGDTCESEPAGGQSASDPPASPIPISPQGLNL